VRDRSSPRRNRTPLRSDLASALSASRRQVRCANG
jgi:hypothetical protein